MTLRSQLGCERQELPDVSHVGAEFRCEKDTGHLIREILKAQRDHRAQSEGTHACGSL